MVQGDPLVTLAYAGSPEPRLRACLQLLEDVFLAETVAEATRTLGSAVGDAVALLGHQALQVIGVPRFQSLNFQRLDRCNMVCRPHSEYKV